MGRKFKMRDGAGYVFMSAGRPAFGKNIVDEDDPDFKGQAYKFEPIPVDEAVAQKTIGDAVAKALKNELNGLETEKRPGLVKLYARIAGEEPPEGITVADLKSVLLLIRDGDASPEEALKEVCGKDLAGSKTDSGV